MTMYPNINVQLDDDVRLPERAHDTDAGADIFAPCEVVIPPARANEDGTVRLGSTIVRTGVHVELPPTTAGLIVSKSGLNVKHGILSEGLIDEGYGGEIVVKLYNTTDKGLVLPAGAKITQMVVIPVMYPKYERVDEIGHGERGSNGFGSTETITGGARL